MGYEIKHENLLKGCVDIHLHVAPSLIERYMDIAEAAARAEKYHYKAVIQKDHHAMSTHCASMIKKHVFANADIQILGAIALNNSVGGLKKEVVQTAIGFGTKIIWLPTVSAKNHIDVVSKTGHFPKLANGVTINETPIVLTDENGKCRQEVVTILEFLAQYPNIALGAGHSSHTEINAVVEKAAEMGLANRIIIDHPTFMVGASLEEIKHWAALGCYIEHIAALTANLSAPHHRALSIEHIVELIRLVGPEQTILSSDFGQKDNCDPVEGFDDYFDMLLANGITEEEIILMSNTNPSKLLGLE